jgi:hypothetical protein
VIVSSGAPAIKPNISFRVGASLKSSRSVVKSAQHAEADAEDEEAACAAASILVHAFSKDGTVGTLLKTLKLTGVCKNDMYVGTTDVVTADDLLGTDFIVASIKNAADSVQLLDVTQECVYQH